MATLTVVTINLAGGEPDFDAADVAGDEFANTSGRTMFHVKNGSGSEVTVTAACQKPCSYGFDHDAVVAVPAGEERIIGPFSTYRFNDSGNKVQVTYSGVSSVTVCAYDLATS